MKDDPVYLSQEHLSAIRDRKDTSSYREELADLDLGSMVNDARKKAFWINVYNARTQELVAAHPILYRTRLLYELPIVHVAGHRISLNSIMHGYLRRSRLAVGRGYLGNPLTSHFEERMRLDAPDPRIHFALNTGARSAPRIRFYSVSNINRELERSTQKYLKSTVRYNRSAGIAHIPDQFRRYSGDFGGRSGIISFLRKHDAIPDRASPALRFNAYDRARSPGRFLT